MKRKTAQLLWERETLLIFFLEMGLYKEALPSLYSFPLEHEFAFCFIFLVTYVSHILHVLKANIKRLLLSPLPP